MVIETKKDTHNMMPSYRGSCSGGIEGHEGDAECGAGVLVFS